MILNQLNRPAIAPEIQEFARTLSTPAEVRFFSLRKLATLAALDRDDQLLRLKIWQQRFSSQAAPNPPDPERFS